MYGSSFMFATLRPRFSISAPIDADTMPLPSDETTPPVTNTNLVCCAMKPFVAPRAGVRQRVSTRSRRRKTSSPKIPADSLLLLQLAPPTGQFGCAGRRGGSGRRLVRGLELERRGNHGSAQLGLAGVRCELGGVAADEPGVVVAGEE